MYWLNILEGIVDGISGSYKHLNLIILVLFGEQVFYPSQPCCGLICDGKGVPGMEDALIRQTKIMANVKFL